MKLFAILLFFVLVSSQLFSQPEIDSSEEVFDKVDIDASFPGGDKAWIKFLQTHLNANVPVDNGAPAGKYTVWVQFIVDKEGNVTALNPLTTQGYGMEAEVMRILKLVPKWTPASQNGRLVKAYRKQPVTFIIEDASFSVDFISGNQVLFIGVDNPIAVTASKVKPKNIAVSISRGTISGSEGNYIVRVNKVERTTITIYNKEKEFGEYSVLATYPSAADSTNPLIRKMKPQDLTWESAGINPEFPGGEKEWQKFLQKNLDKSVPASRGAKKGEYTVWITFFVDKDGRPSDWQVVTNPGYGMNEEALRIVKNVPAWTPAIQGGQKVKCLKQVAITFELE